MYRRIIHAPCETRNFDELRDGLDRSIVTMSVVVLTATPAAAQVFSFSTGDPDGLMAMASRGPNSQIEAADDFITTAPTTVLTGATSRD